MSNKIKKILIASKAKEKLFNIKEAKVVKGKGIIGDRYYLQKGSFSQRLKDKEDFHITFIEQEEIDAFNEKTNLNYSNDLFRRNIVTEGIELNDLVGKKFKINDIEFLGMRLCEPCKLLSLDLGEEFLSQMVHKAGLRAKILSSGSFTLGESIEVL